MQLVMGTLLVDNEEVGQICLRIVIELHKNYRNVSQQLEEWVQPFFDFVTGMLKSLKATMTE